VLAEAQAPPQRDEPAAAPLRHRGVQPVGRLDEDTTGLLLLTDDGTLIHRLTSPKHHVPKVYEVQLQAPVDDTAGAAPAGRRGAGRRPGSRCVPPPARRWPDTLRLTLTEGKYHQVKRMVAAVGNRVEGLHRSSFGSLVCRLTWHPANGAGQCCSSL
jgi:16S rRNA pseudouridine516 synthase